MPKQIIIYPYFDSVSILTVSVFNPLWCSSLCYYLRPLLWDNASPLPCDWHYCVSVVAVSKPVVRELVLFFLTILYTENHKFYNSSSLSAALQSAPYNCCSRVVILSASWIVVSCMSILCCSQRAPSSTVYFIPDQSTSQPDNIIRLVGRRISGRWRARGGKWQGGIHIALHDHVHHDGGFMRLWWKEEE